MFTRFSLKFDGANRCHHEFNCGLPLLPQNLNANLGVNGVAKTGESGTTAIPAVSSNMLSVLSR